MSFADYMRRVSNTQRSNTDDLETRRYKDVMDLFFNSRINTIGLRSIIHVEAKKGYLSAVIFQYDYYEYFSIDDNNVFTYYPTFTKGTGRILYRIHNIIQEPYFIELMNKFICQHLGMLYDVVRLKHMGKTKNGIEVFWGSPNDSNISEKWFNKMMETMVTTTVEPKRILPKTPVF